MILTESVMSCSCFSAVFTGGLTYESLELAGHRREVGEVM
jgi:hypothetical protein